MRIKYHDTRIDPSILSRPLSTDYLYSYDDIGNRLTASEPADSVAYTANALNQYSISSNLCVAVPLL